MSEPRSPRPYSLAEHVYAGNGLDTLRAGDLEDLAALVVIAERAASRPMVVGDLDRLLADCVRAEGDTDAQWRHELIVDESLRAIVEMLLPGPAVALQRVMADRLHRQERD